MELGLYTFAELTSTRSRAGRPRPRLRDLVEEIELADQVGLDVFGVGEHHRPDFAVSAPAVVLAAAAERTKRIRLTSAVNVLSSDDPVRVFQAVRDARPALRRPRRDHGRPRLVHRVLPALRLRPRDYDELFAEKLELLLALREARGHLVGQAPRGDRRPRRLPAPLQDPLPIWVAVGGTPGVGGARGRARPADGARDHRRHAGALRAVRRDPPARGRARPGTTRPALSINSHGYVADTSQAGRGECVPAVRGDDDRIGRERGWPPMGREDFEASPDAARRELRRQPARR